VTYDGILKSIFKNQPTKGKGVVKKIKENLPGIYMTMEPDEWNNEFPEGASFMKNEIIDKILAIIDQIQQ
jgi:hypothetical protein